MFRKFTSHLLLMLKALATFQATFEVLNDYFVLRDMCFDKLCRKVEKPLISSFVVCVCGHASCINEAIIRERHPIPTAEEILHDFNWSTVFSKIYLKWGFHQILISEDSRHITTFVTQRVTCERRRISGCRLSPLHTEGFIVISG